MDLEIAMTLSVDTKPRAVIGDSNEEWLLCPGFSDYEISSKGNVRRIRSKRNIVLLVPRALHINHGGYPSFTFFVDGRSTNKQIHPLVCEAFHGPKPSPIHQAAHWDGNHANNSKDNLRWATPIENMADSLRLGRVQRGSKRWNATLTEEDVKDIKRRLAAGETGLSIAKHYRIGRPTVSDIKKGKKWKHV
jgi:HNH endonuclease/NUMOD4 motif